MEYSMKPMNFVKLVFFIIAVEVNGQYHHEGDYWATLDRSVMKEYNHSYLSDVKYYISFINRTVKGINFEFTLLRNLSRNLKVNIQVYKMLSNEYRYFPITLTLNMCEEYRKDTFGIKNMMNRYSNIRACPPNEGQYYIRNAPIDVSTYPPLIPAGQYEVQERCVHELDLVYEINTFYRVTEYIKRWKNRQ